MHELNLDNPAHVKLCLILDGVTFEPAAVGEVGSRFAERPMAYNSADQPLRDLPAVPAELILADDVIAGVRYRRTSPWRVALGANQGLVLKRGDDVICPVTYPDRPPYYEHRIRSGKPARQVITQFSNFAVGVFLERSCYLWRIDKPCRFCSVEPTRLRNREMDDEPDHEELLEAIELAFQLDPRLRYVECSGGNDEDYDRGFRRSTEFLAALTPRLPDHVRKHLNIMPPRDLGLLTRLAVVEEPTFALEVWDPQLFEEVCPGKHETYGREGFMEVFRTCVQLYGRGRVSCNLVCGMEPIDSLISGCQTLAAMGVVPQVAMFHPDPGTAYAKREPPAIPDALRVVRALRDIYRAHGYRPYLLGSRRTSLDGEAYLGYFD